MAEVVVGPVIEVLLENLVELSKNQIGLVRHFKDDLKKLQKTFSMVNGFLNDAQKKQVTSDAFKIWLTELEDLTFEADNIIDGFNYRLLAKKVGANKYKRVKRKVKSFCSGYRLKLGKDIKDINDKFESISQTASKLGLQNIAAQAPLYAASASSQTDSFSEDPIFLGRKKDVSSIVDTLITAEQKLSVLPIVGMGGQGKTTLARKVFNCDKIKSHFGDNRVWVHVPRIFDVIVLLERILTSIKAENHVEHGNREALLKTLQKELGAKKYLLLLDDVWNEDREKWVDFERSLLGISSVTGNCMMVTTRSENVVSIVGPLRVHKLKGLSKDDCWSIIKAKAFGEGDNYPSEFKAIGENVAKKCGGSPLAANVVGGLLVGKSKDEWMSIEKGWLGDDNPITKILRLSFDSLPSSSVKKCFAYCSMFPKGYQIGKQQLVELWMAEGFVQTLDGNRIFNLLLQSSLLQVRERDDYGNVINCNMHDLVHDLAHYIMYENVNVKYGVCRRRYIGYKPSGDGSMDIPKDEERYVRTLFFDGKVSDIRFSDFESLRTLIFFVGEEEIEELPTSIRKLKHLRYLDVSKIIIKYNLPDSIGELYHLQTLRAHDSLEKLPDSMSSLISLRHLHISYNTALPQRIGKLISLQTLPYFPVKGCGISELGNLKDLKGKLKIFNLENVRDKNDAISANLLEKAGLYKLALIWHPEFKKRDEVNDESELEELGKDELKQLVLDECKKRDDVNDESVLEGLQPHPNLKRLEIREFRGKSLSLWEGLNNLVEIKLRECCKCEELSMFVFPVLERLELLFMINLRKWDDGVVFPRLKYLKIVHCWQFTGAPCHFPCLEELVIFFIESSLALENICGIKLTSLKKLKICLIEGLECLPDWLFSNNRNLTELEIYACPNMTHLVPHMGGAGGAPSPLLRKLTIYNCPSLRELPYDLHSLNWVLDIRYCPELKSMPYPIISSQGGQQQQQQHSVTYMSGANEDDDRSRDDAS
ncbi:hypothetical protein CASFOL_012548 [Castilleja foliolosa]|uniref:Disease resistance protein RGA3 n=1 Tax=Castilleja foliolosa TaxID=1961234 RepID=A0ABD3DHZ3_9LAMI